MLLSLWAKIVFFSLKLIILFFETLTLNDPDWHFNHDFKIIDIKSLILISNMTTFHSDWNLTFFDLFSDIFDLWLRFCDPEKHFLEKLRSRTSFFIWLIYHQSNRSLTFIEIYDLWWPQDHFLGNAKGKTSFWHFFCTTFNKDENLTILRFTGIFDLEWPLVTFESNTSINGFILI